MSIHSLRSRSVIPLCCVLLIAGCTSETKPPRTNPPRTNPPRTNPQATTLPPVDAQQPGNADSESEAAVTGAADRSGVSMEEAEQFAQKWETAIRSGDTEGGVTLLDLEVISERTLAPFGLGDQFRAGFEIGLKNSIKMLIEQLTQEEQNGGYYRLVKVAMRAGEPHAMFRLLGADGSLNYHDLRIIRKQNALVADQFFIAMTGEDLVDTLRANVEPAIRARQSNRTSGEEEKQLQILEKQNELVLAARTGDFERANQIYDELPAEAKGLKSVQIGRLMAASYMESDEYYLKIIDEYKQRFPNDPSLPIITIDAAVMREDLDQLEASHAALQRWVGGDPLLDLIIGSTLASYGRVTRAEEMVAGIDVDAIGMADAHDYALNLALLTKDHEATLAHLRKLREYGVEIGDLSEAEGFEGFVGSPSYQSWLEDQ